MNRGRRRSVFVPVAHGLLVLFNVFFLNFVPVYNFFCLIVLFIIIIYFLPFTLTFTIVVCIFFYHSSNVLLFTPPTVVELHARSKSYSSKQNYGGLCLQCAIIFIISRCFPSSRHQCIDVLRVKCIRFCFRPDGNCLKMNEELNLFSTSMYVEPVF